METAQVDRWFREYLSTFAACGRGESQAAELLTFYGVPLIVTTDKGVITLLTSDEVTAVVQRQVDAMLEAKYAQSDVLELVITILNKATALCTGTFLRRQRDGTEIGRLTATYLLTGISEDRRISSLTVHGC